MYKASAIARPHIMMLALEPLRAIAALSRLKFMSRDIRAPSGDGHAVVLFPGLGTDQHYMTPPASIAVPTALWQHLQRGAAAVADGPRWTVGWQQEARAAMFASSS